jgi:hypothetical protein
VVFEELPLASQVVTGSDNFISDRFALEDCYPNPAKEKVIISFKVNAENHVLLELYNKEGKLISVLADKRFEPGSHQVVIDVTDMSTGQYIYQLRSGFFKASKKLVVTK